MNDWLYNVQVFSGIFISITLLPEDKNEEYCLDVKIWHIFTTKWQETLLLFF